jgi:CRP/FNR family cyclic AMP-dependent transcriptional regulator
MGQRNTLDLLEIFKDDDALERYPAGSTIIEEGARGDLMYVVVDGRVRISLRHQLLAIVGKGGIFGEMVLISPDIRSATVVADTDCKLAPIDQASFDSMLRHVPDFSMHVMKVLSERLQNAYEMIEP